MSHWLFAVTTDTVTVTDLLDRHSVTSRFWIWDLPPKLISQPLSVEFHTGCWPSCTPKHSCCSLPLVCSPAMFRMLESKWIYRTWILNSVSLLAHDLVKQGWETERPSWEFTAINLIFSCFSWFAELKYFSLRLPAVLLSFRDIIAPAHTEFSKD